MKYLPPSQIVYKIWYQLAGRCDTPKHLGAYTLINATFTHLSYHIPGRFSSVCRRILDNVSPNFSVFVNSSLLHISNSQSSPLKCFPNSIKLSLPGPPHRSFALWLPFKVSSCQTAVVPPLDMPMPYQLALFHLVQKGLR